MLLCFCLVSIPACVNKLHYYVVEFAWRKPRVQIWLFLISLYYVPCGETHDLIINRPMWVRLTSLFVLRLLVTDDPELTFLAEAHLCTNTFTYTSVNIHAYILCVCVCVHSASGGVNAHTCNTRDEQVYVFPEKPIFSSHGSTTGGTWCYINALWFSAVSTLRPLSFAFHFPSPYIAIC